MKRARRYCLVLAFSLLGSVPCAAEPEGGSGDLEMPIFLMDDVVFIPGQTRSIARALCSQYGRVQVLRPVVVATELRTLHRFLLAEKEEQGEFFSLMVLEYCRAAATVLLAEEEHQPKVTSNALSEVASICGHILKDIPAEDLTTALAWQKAIEDEVRRKEMTRRGYGPETTADPPVYPVGTHAVLVGETAWDRQKRKQFVWLRAHELRECLQVKDRKRLRHMLSAGGATDSIPMGLAKIGESITEKERFSAVEGEGTWLDHKRRIEKRRQAAVRALGETNPSSGSEVRREKGGDFQQE